MSVPFGSVYLRASLSWPLQFDIQWRKMSLPLPATDMDNGEDCDPIESVKIGDNLDPSFPLNTTV